MRYEVASWYQTFMRMAHAIAQRSKDPDTIHGSIIVEDKTNKVLGVGYNGLPYGMRDNLDIIDPIKGKTDIWTKEMKHNFVIHAEVNAILNATDKLANSTLFLYSEKGYYPCCNCAQIIAQKGITTVVVNKVVLDKKHGERYNFWATKQIFKHCGINVTEYKYVA